MVKIDLHLLEASQNHVKPPRPKKDPGPQYPFAPNSNTTHELAPETPPVKLGGPQNASEAAAYAGIKFINRP